MVSPKIGVHFCVYSPHGNYPPFLMQFNDEQRLMGYHQKLQNIIEDQLSLAAIHYLRTHYQEAIDIYKKILLDNRYSKCIREEGSVDTAR